MRILHDSTNEFYRSPFGALKSDQNCRIRLQVPISCNTNTAYLVLEKDENKSQLAMNKCSVDEYYDTFSIDFSLNETGIYYYYFYLETKETDFSLFRYDFYDTNIEDGDKWQITCYPKDFVTPDFLADSVMYQIFPDRFAKCGENDLSEKLTPFHIHSSVDECPDYLPDEKGIIMNNDFFGGNFKGIENEIPYLVSLGIKIIYLNPICKAFSNHRYDTADYMKIDPMLGTEQDFKRLCDVCHKNGIRVILDGVFSHTGSDSVYFDSEKRFGNGALSCDSSPYKEWYKFDNSAIGYESWWGISTLPCVDELNPDYIEYIITGEDSVVAHWLGLGADGFRLDVADELPDEFIAALRKRIKEINPNALLYGEVWEDASNKISYGIQRKYFTDGELDGVMNYPFREAILDLLLGKINSKEFGIRINTIAEHYPQSVIKLLMNSLSTHDTPRIITLLSGVTYDDRTERADARLTEEQFCNAVKLEKLATLLQYTIPGIPCVYYGDEIGMEGYEDPFNRRFFNREAWHPEMAEYHKQLAKLKKLPQFQSEKVSFVYHDTLVIMKRTAADGSFITVVINPTDKDVRYSVSGEMIMNNNASYEMIGAYGFTIIR